MTTGTFRCGAGNISTNTSTGCTPNARNSSTRDICPSRGTIVATGTRRWCGEPNHSEIATVTLPPSR